MKKTLLIIFFGLSLFINVTAQRNLTSGYILKNKFDTLYGVIDDKNYYLNSQFCDFRENKSDSLKRYYPKDIYGYRFIDGKYYISKALGIAGKDSIMFLEFLINGEVDFYFSQDKSKINHYYASKENSPILELKYSKELLHIDSKIYERENKQYISVLEYFTRDYPDFKNDIYKLNEPNHKNLIRIGEDYHNHVCKDRKCIIYDKKIRYRLLLEIAGGYKIFTNRYDYYRLSGNPFFGISFYIILKENRFAKNYACMS